MSKRGNRLEIFRMKKKVGQEKSGKKLSTKLTFLYSDQRTFLPKSQGRIQGWPAFIHLANN